MMNKLELDHITFRIKTKEILKDISITMESGHVYAFVGPNGSGKTMLFRAIAGLIKLNNGEIRWNGKVLRKDIEVIPKIGLTLENAGMYPDLSGYNNLKLLAKINHSINDQQILSAIEQVGLDPREKKPIRKYSLGMKQRISLAQAIMENPDLLVLDEPTNALDPDGIEMVRELIRYEKESGKLIILASHSMEDVKLLADKVYIMNNGVCVEDEA